MALTKQVRSTADVQTVVVTTRVLHVDLAAQLRDIDPMDNVVLMISTPSGRDKRVALGGNFLVESFGHLNEEPWA